MRYGVFYRFNFIAPVSFPIHPFSVRYGILELVCFRHKRKIHGVLGAFSILSDAVCLAEFVSITTPALRKSKPRAVGTPFQYPLNSVTCCCAPISSGTISLIGLYHSCDVSIGAPSKTALMMFSNCLTVKHCLCGWRFLPAQCFQKRFVAVLHLENVLIRAKQCLRYPIYFCSPHS